MSSKGPMAPTKWIEESRAFLEDVRVEFRKIAWPTQNETMAGTISVFVVVGIVAVALGLVDLGLSELMAWVLP